MNSGCPSFRALWEGFLDVLTPEVLSAGAGAGAVDLTLFPPEQLFFRLASLGRRYRRSIDATLVRYLMGKPPNRNHYALASVLAQGATVWTTNYDTLIEDAAKELGVLCHALAWPNPPVCNDPACGAPHLYKPHGSFRPVELHRQQLIYQSVQVLKGLDEKWADAFRTSLGSHHVVVAGYSGNDVDVMPILIEEVRRSISSFVWYELDLENAAYLRDKMPAGVRVEEANPSERLQEECLRLLGAAPGSIPSDPATTASKVKPVGLRPKRAHLARAILLDHFDQPTKARQELRQSFPKDPPSAWPKALPRLARGLAFDEPTVNRLARALTRRLSGFPHPSVSARAWAAYLLFNETYGTRPAVVEEIGRYTQRRPPEQWPLPARVSAASHVKLFGTLPRVSELIDAGILADASPSLRGKGAYNLLWALRYEGRYDEWRAVWEAHVEVAGLLDPNWAAWLQLEQSDMAAMLGNGVEANSALDTVAVRFARERRRHRLYVIDADTSELRAAVVAGGPIEPAVDGFRALLDRVAEDSVLDTPYRQASLQLGLASLLGPVDQPEVRVLVDAAEAVTPSELHLVFAGLLRHRHGLANPPSIQDLLERCRRLSFGYGEARVIRELSLPDEDAVLRGANPFLSVRRGPEVWVVP